MKNGKPFALSLMVAAFLLLLTACGAAQQSPAPAETSASSGGTLMEDVGENGGTYFDNKPVFGSPTLTRGQVRSITFLSDASDAPDGNWDVSQEQNGSVVAWAVMNGELYDLFIASDGGVIAPENCHYMFHAYSHMESIAFNSALDTSHVTDMSGMFYHCEKLTALDVSGFDTSHVIDMSHMFSSCEALNTLDMSGFDTSNVKNMSGMFSFCPKLTTLDVSGFDTSNVEDMSAMFDYCEHLRTLDISAFNTSNVKNMRSMFAFLSQKELELNLGAFDTSNVESVEGMFYGCFAVTEEDVSKLDLSSATDADRIFSMRDMTTPKISYFSDGRTYNAGQ